MVTTLSSARSLAVESIKKAQSTYKHYYDIKTEQQNLKVGDLMLVRFPHEEQGKLRKLSRPWHGPYRVVSRDDPDVTVVKMYFPQEPAIQIHQTRVCPCPVGFPPGYYWYGRKQHSSGPPSWVEDVLERCLPAEPEAELTDSTEQPGLESTDELNEELNEEVETVKKWKRTYSSRIVILLTQIHGHPTPKWTANDPRR